MEKNSNSGKTFYDLAFIVFHRVGPLKIIAIVSSVFAVGWGISHISAEPGTLVKVWNLFEYTKRADKPADTDNASTIPAVPEDELIEETGLPQISSQVLARWEGGNNCYYLGEEIEKKDDQSRVIFEFGEDKWISADRVVDLLSTTLQSNPEIGDNVFVRFSKGTPTWIPSTIVQIGNNRYQATIDEKARETCGIDRQSLWVGMDRIAIPNR